MQFKIFENRDLSYNLRYQTDSRFLLVKTENWNKLTTVLRN